MKLLRKLQHSIEQLNKIRVKVDAVAETGLEKTCEMLDEVIKDMESIENKMHRFNKVLKDLGKKYKD